MIYLIVQIVFVFPFSRYFFYIVVHLRGLFQSLFNVVAQLGYGLFIAFSDLVLPGHLTLDVTELNLLTLDGRHAVVQVAYALLEVSQEPLGLPVSLLLILLVRELFGLYFVQLVLDDAQVSVGFVVLQLTLQVGQ